MKNLVTLFSLFILPLSPLWAQQKTLSANVILEKVDENMYAKSQIITSEMIVYGKRKSRTIRSRGYSVGQQQNFTEYLYPQREKGTKMLKLDDRLWIYSPTTDRIIQLSGHLLRQSVMGSDLSYEDMMEERKLREIYTPSIIAVETVDDRTSWKMELLAIVEDVSYFKRILWVDQERFVPLREELYAKSGQLLKRTTLSEVKKIDGRWYPTKINYKDVLKEGVGTDFIVTSIEFNASIPERIFLKSSLKE